MEINYYSTELDFVSFRQDTNINPRPHREPPSMKGVFDKHHEVTFGDIFSSERMIALDRIAFYLTRRGAKFDDKCLIRRTNRGVSLIYKGIQYTDNTDGDIYTEEVK